MRGFQQIIYIQNRQYVNYFREIVTFLYTVVGHRKGHAAVVFTAVEKVTRNYIAIRIPERTKEGMEAAISQLKEKYGVKHFSTVFKTMTADNDSEFTTFSKLESLRTKVYFAHPYSSWERPQNERHIRFDFLSLEQHPQKHKLYIFIFCLFNTYFYAKS